MPPKKGLSLTAMGLEIQSQLQKAEVRAEQPHAAATRGPIARSQAQAAPSPNAHGLAVTRAGQLSQHPEQGEPGQVKRKLVLARAIPVSDARELALANPCRLDRAAARKSLEPQSLMQKVRSPHEWVLE